jgi:hypothetical protein
MSSFESGPEASLIAIAMPSSTQLLRSTLSCASSSASPVLIAFKVARVLAWVAFPTRADAFVTFTGTGAVERLLFAASEIAAFLARKDVFVTFAGTGAADRCFFACLGLASSSLDKRMTVGIGRPVFLLTMGLSLLEMLMTDALRERGAAIEFAVVDMSSHVDF